MTDTPTQRILALPGDRQIEVFEAGRGAPLLFLHGAGGFVWEGALPLLAREFHVMAPLLPGYGRSTGLDAIDDVLELCFHGFDVIEALGIERPYVVGDSLGGWLAAEMAAVRPKEIGRLGLAAPIGLWRDAAPVVDMFGLMTHELVPYLFHDQSCPAAQRMLATTQLLSDQDDRTAEQIETLIAMARGARTAAKFLFPIPETGLERRLPRIAAPTLLLWGDQDRFVAPSYADIFAAKIPDARLTLVRGAGHAIAAEQPEAYARAVVAWGHGTTA